MSDQINRTHRSRTLAEGGDWDEARAYAGLLGRPHTLFTNAIRYLRNLTQHGTTVLSETEPYPLAVLLKSPSLRAILYYAAAALRKDELGKLPQLDGFGLLRVFPPDELAAILTTTYLFRKVKKIIDPRIWETLSQEIQIQMEAGFYIGTKMPAIGTSRGLLVGVIRYSALSLFSKKDPRNFKAFRRELNDKEKLFNIKGELTRWGCDHLQIASILLQSMGMGIPCAKALAADSMPTEAEADSEEMLSWYAARAWIQSLIEDEKAPACFAAGSPFFCEGEVFANLQERVDSIYEMGSSFDWIEKTKEDLPKSLFDKIGSGLPEPTPEQIAANEPDGPAEDVAEIL
ncbi:MAG: hypothetical protein J0M12_06955 [Deltaproteobacteria bacterium]|nr:hypothetical protein [Deltaproteobacteria bacterium]